ncbi:MAG: HAD family phosphatase [Bacteroidaceae bacterium]|nr:HAD family phosphatase [Bacteroidaceae bacterium]
MITQLKAVLFDLDGTLVDSEGQYTRMWSEVGRRWAPQVPTLAQDIKGTTMVQILQRYFPDADVQRQVVESIGEMESRMDFTLFPGAVDFVLDLRRNGLLTAVVTSSDTGKMQKFCQAHPRFGTLFDRILTSEDFHASKPAPDPYLRAAAALGVGIRQCVVVEDAFTGLESGMRSGAFTLGLATTNPREQIKNRCHHVWDSLEGQTFDTLCRAVGLRGRED